MPWWNPFAAKAEPEARSISVQEFMAAAGVMDLGGVAATGVAVTTETALRVPAVSAAANFIANEMASLPCDVFRRKPDGSRESVSGGLAVLLHDAPNDYMTSFEWRKNLLLAKLTGGRGLTYIERSPSGTVLGLWAMDPARTTIKRDGFVVSYEYRDDRGIKRYRADEVIDLPFMLMPDGITSRGPIQLGREAIGMAIALTQYSSRFFAGGGVPPFAITGPTTPAGLKAAADDMARAVAKAKSENRLALALPPGVEIKQIGANPEQSQMVEGLRFCIEEIARIYSIPPTFLQDLTHGTYSNTEQQDLHFVKHTLLHHAKQFEQELNLKLFGRKNNRTYVELNMDGLLRGDFKTRMEGLAAAVNSAIMTPNEARGLENWPSQPDADQLFIQGATVPIGQAGQQPAAAASNTQGSTQ